MMEKLPHTKAKYTRQLDSPFGMWFCYRLPFQPKVMANLGFGFGIGPKSK